MYSLKAKFSISFLLLPNKSSQCSGLKQHFYYLPISIDLKIYTGTASLSPLLQVSPSCIQETASAVVLSEALVSLQAPSKCWQNSSSYYCRTNVPIFLLPVGQETTQLLKAICSFLLPGLLHRLSHNMEDCFFKASTGEVF